MQMDYGRRYEALENRIAQLEKELSERTGEVQLLKHSVLSYISHEIRTPMHAIMGFSELLSDEHLSPEEREEYTLYIQECCMNLLNVVENMIDASLLENKELKFIFQECDLNEILQELYQHFRILKHRMEKYSVAILLNSEIRDTEYCIQTDPLRLKQVLNGLIGNALKFTNKGVVEFGYFLKEEATIQFYVSDSGEGGLAKAGQLLLENFSRIGYNGSGNNLELGMGLRISKGIVEAMGGKIWVEPNNLNGSTFSFTIPHSPAKKNTRALEYSSELKQVI
jgi:signal transduction histidine kinase